MIYVTSLRSLLSHSFSIVMTRFIAIAKEDRKRSVYYVARDNIPLYFYFSDYKIFHRCMCKINDK